MNNGHNNENKTQIVKGKILQKSAILGKNGFLKKYLNVSDDDTLPIGIEEVVAFGITANHFRNSPLHLRETGEYMF